jgi:PAS domain S-box-containing protein
MADEKNSEDKCSDLRARAEETLSSKPEDVEDISALSPEEIQSLIHELRVHQIELEIQNEELRLAQTKLEELKDKYLDLYDFALVGYVTSNEKGLILEANLTAVRLLGVERKSLIKKPFSRFVCQQFRDAYYLHLRQVLETQSKQTCEIELVRKDGSQFYAQLESVAVRDESGEFNRYRTIVWDITDRKRIEEFIRIRLSLLEYSASHSLEDLLQKTLDDIGSLTDSPIGFYHFISEDEKTIYLQMWSTRTMKEFCTAEGKGQHYPVDQGGVWVDAVRERRPVIHNDYSTLPHRKGMPEGHAPIVRELVVPIMRADRIVAILGIGNKPSDYTQRDVEAVSYLADVAWEITKRKRAEEALRAASTYRRLIDASLDPFVTISAEGKISDANRATEEVTGYSRNELIGTDFADYFTERQNARTVYQQVFRDGSVRDYELEIQHKNGRVTPVIYNASLYRDEHGNVVGIFAAARDISDRKWTEGELIRSNKDLQQFAYVTSHDLQEPLRNVATCLQLLEKDYKNKLDANADQYINYAVEGAVRMKALIQDLLAFSRVGTKGKPSQPTDCEQLLDQTVKNLRSAITEATAVITHDPLPTIFADDSQLLQVFQNLIQNAIKFRRDETPQIHVSAVKNKNEWIFSVKDNGIGIESQHLDRIFVIFQRLHKRSQYDGTGIGLAIVKKVAERHGGRIWVESEPGVGSTFYFTIPEKGF